MEFARFAGQIQGAHIEPLDFANFFVSSEDQAVRSVPDLEWGNADNPLT
jgi:hypothetical protein